MTRPAYRCPAPLNDSTTTGGITKVIHIVDVRVIDVRLQTSLPRLQVAWAIRTRFAYCLRITDVDPIDFDLIFERFLNPERVSLPDIDIDFCERRRGEVIDYVTRKYGRENVAQIITFGTMKARAVVRDVGRVMEFPISEVDKVAKLIPASLDMTLDKAIEEAPALAELEKKDERVRELLKVARRLEGMTRHASIHAAGVVIAPKPLVEFVPLYKSQKEKDEITTQWSMKEIESPNRVSKNSGRSTSCATFFEPGALYANGVRPRGSFSNVPRSAQSSMCSRRDSPPDACSSANFIISSQSVASSTKVPSVWSVKRR